MYSHLALDCYYALYYYQESESYLKVCVWTLDRKKQSMDKLVLNTKLVNGCAVPDATIDTHVGTLIDFDGIAVDPDGCINIKALMKVDGKVVHLSMPIKPVRRKNSICNSASIRRNGVLELAD